MSIIASLEDEQMIAVSQLRKIRDDILNAIAPDGRPYGMTKLSKRERLRQYTENLRGNPDAWRQWMSDRVFEIHQALAAFPPEKIALVAPWNIAQQMALSYSASMERELATEMRKADESGT